MSDELANLLKLAKESGGTAQIVWRNKDDVPLAVAVVVNGMSGKETQAFLDGVEDLLNKLTNGEV